MGLKQRNGTNTDCENLKNTLTKLGFEVAIHNDLKFKEIEALLEEAAVADHSNEDCILVTVLSHGEAGIVYASDHPYKPDRLWAPFSANKCPSLAGKPKVFLMQCCQGDQLDDGLDLRKFEDEVNEEEEGEEDYDNDDFVDGSVSNQENEDTTSQQLGDKSFDEGDGWLGFFQACETAPPTPDTASRTGSFVYKIPSHADFLIACSTIPGFYSWRNTTTGSWFIQAICHILDREAERSELTSMLTAACRIVALDFQSNTPGDHLMHEKKQIPCITSMLTREVYLRSKQLQQAG